MLENDRKMISKSEWNRKEEDRGGDEACPPGFVRLLFSLSAIHLSPLLPLSLYTNSDRQKHTHTDTNTNMRGHTLTRSHVPNLRVAWCFWPMAQSLGCVSACVFMYFKAVLFRMQAGRKSGFSADKSIWLISFCPRPLTRSALLMCVCVGVCVRDTGYWSWEDPWELGWG